MVKIVFEKGRWEVVLREVDNVRYYVVRDKRNRRRQIQISSISYMEDLLNLCDCLIEIAAKEEAAKNQKVTG